MAANFIIFLSAVSDYCMVCFFRKAFLKSDTAVALRMSASKIPCITVVSFSNVYYEYSCKLMWLSENSKYVLELLNVRRQCKLRFLDINMNFTEQNIHELCNMTSYECHLIKIIKSLWFIWSIFLLFVTPIFGWKNGCVFWLGSDLTIIYCAFAVKPFEIGHDGKINKKFL